MLGSTTAEQQNAKTSGIVYRYILQEPVKDWRERAGARLVIRPITKGDKTIARDKWGNLAAVHFSVAKTGGRWSLQLKLKSNLGSTTVNYS